MANTGRSLVGVTLLTGALALSCPRARDHEQDVPLPPPPVAELAAVTPLAPPTPPANVGATPTERRTEDDPRRRATPELLTGDLVIGAPDARVTIVAMLALPSGAASPALHAVVRGAGRAGEDRVRVVFRPRLAGVDPIGLRLARLYLALPDDGARLKWLAALLGTAADPWRAAEGLTRDRPLALTGGDAPEVDAVLQAWLQEQGRLAVEGADVVFVNGRRFEPAPAEDTLSFAVRRERQRLEQPTTERSPRPRREDGFKQAEQIGPRSLSLPGGVGSANETFEMVAFVDFRDPYSRRLAKHVAAFLAESPLARHVRLRLAALPLERHAGAAEAAAVARCALSFVEDARVLAAFFGDPYDRPDVRPEGLCDALALPADARRQVLACATLPGTADAVLAEAAAAHDAGVLGPPALFIDGRRVAPRGRRFSPSFLEDVLLGYYLRTWTFPPEGRLDAIGGAGAGEPHGRSP